MKMNRFTSRFRLMGIFLFSLLLLHHTNLVYGADIEPSISFSFDENDERIIAIENTEGTLTQITDFKDFSFTSGKVDNCLYLDGSYGLELNIGRLNPKSYTISFWVKPSEINAHTPILSIVKGDFEDNNYSTVLLDENWLQPNITSIYTDDAGSSSYSAGISGALNSDIWTHIAIVVDGTGSLEEYFDNMSLYIDGEYACDGLMLKNICNNDSNFIIGINPYSDSFKGYIDDLLIFNTALTAEDILSVYNLDNASSQKPNDNDGHGTKPGGNSDRPGHHHGTESGNIFDDIIDIDQGSLPDVDNSSLSSYLDPGLAAGMEYKTDVYAETALVFALIFAIISLCCFLNYIKKRRNQY